MESTTGDKKQTILDALNRLSAGGSTNGGVGIEAAYRIAREHFIAGGSNRVILCSDGDFNVGTTSNDALVALVEENAKSKVFLTVLGFGIGNTNDSMMEQITNRGNGVYGFIDSHQEARRMLVDQLSGRSTRSRKMLRSKWSSITPSFRLSVARLRKPHARNRRF